MNPYDSGPSGWQDREPPNYQYPAYGGQGAGHGSGYGGPTQPPPTGSEPPPPPPKSPKWLWLAAGAAVLLVAGLVVALFVVNGSSDKATAGSKVSTASEGPGSRHTTTRTTTKKPTSSSEPTTSTSSEPGTQDSVTYEVTGTGKAISIVYTESEGEVETEFNVELPWTKEVSLSSSTPATLTVANMGDEITCTITVNGEQVSQRTGKMLTVCASTS